MFENLKNYDFRLFIKHLALHKGCLDVLAQKKKRTMLHLRIWTRFRKQAGKETISPVLAFFEFVRLFSCLFGQTNAILFCRSLRSNLKTFFWCGAICTYSSKEFFPYLYVTDVSKLEKTHLPQFRNFYGQLHGENILSEDRDQARLVSRFVQMSKFRWSFWCLFKIRYVIIDGYIWKFINM